ncbi:uncharacterized protein LOC135398670 [Ornithodoros turicata]|uniref:uncharacterized protein LOC135398670 n=1 Tax=Ornithodoros turicata TaxID=34597 RepID=UPI003139051E
MASRLLKILPSSAACGRNWSEFGNIHTAVKNRLKNERFEKLAFVHSYLNFNKKRERVHGLKQRPYPTSALRPWLLPLLSTWFSRYGVPDDIVTDRGAQFESSPFLELCRLLGAKRSRTTSYHPCANGLVERFHRQLKTCFRALPDTKWSQALPLILLHLIASLKPDLGCSSAELVLGTTLRLPADLIVQQPPTPAPAHYASLLSDVFRSLAATPPRYPHSRPTHVPSALATSTHVFVQLPAPRRCLQSPYAGLYRVVTRSAKTFVIEVAGQHQTVSIDRLKPALVDPQPAAPQALLVDPALSSAPASAFPSPARHVTWSPSVASAPLLKRGGGHV